MRDVNDSALPHAHISDQSVCGAIRCDPARGAQAGRVVLGIGGVFWGQGWKILEGNEDVTIYSRYCG
jgi:hypothetical protein